MADSSGTPEAGWYDDPAQPGRQRYWDGSGWTTETRSGLSDMPPPRGPMAGSQPGAPQRTVGFAIASFVLGVLSLVFFAFILPSILAVVFGHLGLRQTKASGNTLRGRGLAITGLVLGYLSIAFFVLVLLAVGESVAEF